MCGESHEILLHTVVQGALDAATLGVGGPRESRPRGSKLFDLSAQSIECSLLVGLPGPQRTPPCVWNPGSCPSSPAPRQGATTVPGRKAASLRSTGRHR